MVSALNSPTKATAHGAVDERRGHLNALMALYPIELLLVAYSVMDKRFVEPPATFDSGVPSHQVILLTL